VIPTTWDCTENKWMLGQLLFYASGWFRSFV
jgi:hypothetical protein